MTLAIEICRHNSSLRGTGCGNPTGNPGDCLACKGVAEAFRCFGPDVRTLDMPRPPASLACHICQREAVHGLAYHSKPLCAHCAPYPNAGELLVELTTSEEEAIEAGGAHAGAYLDAIGKTDLATLTHDEWSAFLCKVLGGYSDYMREAVKSHPPF